MNCLRACLLSLLLARGALAAPPPVTEQDAETYLNTVQGMAELPADMRSAMLANACANIPACAGECRPLLLSLLRPQTPDQKTQPAEKPECKGLALPAAATREQRESSARAWAQPRLLALAARVRTFWDPYEQEEFGCMAGALGWPGGRKCKRPVVPETKAQAPWGRIEESAGLYENKRAGIRAQIPKGYKSLLAADGDCLQIDAPDAGGIFVFRGGPLSAKQMNHQIRLSYHDSTNFLPAIQAALGNKVDLVSQSAFALPLGRGQQATWKGQSMQMQVILLSVCKGQANVMLQRAWATPAAKEITDRWLASFQQRGVCDAGARPDGITK